MLVIWFFTNLKKSFYVSYFTQDLNMAFPLSRPAVAFVIFVMFSWKYWIADDDYVTSAWIINKLVCQFQVVGSFKINRNYCFFILCLFFVLSPAPCHQSTVTFKIRNLTACHSQGGLLSSVTICQEFSVAYFILVKFYKFW